MRARSRCDSDHGRVSSHTRLGTPIIPRSWTSAARRSSPQRPSNAIQGNSRTAVALSLFYSTIYRETSGSAPDLKTYQDAYGFGMLAVALFVVIAFAIVVADLSGRRRHRTALGQADPVAG